MARPKTKRKIVRISVSLDDRDYQTLRKIAETDDVSVAWLIRRAVGDFLKSGAVRTEQAISPTKAVGR